MMIAVLAAVKRELAPLLQILHFRESKRIGPWEVHLSNQKSHCIAAAYSGCGKVRAAAATQMIIDHFKPANIILYGTAGAISPQRKPGDIILESNSIEADYQNLMNSSIEFPISQPDRFLTEKLVQTCKQMGVSPVSGIIITQDKDIVSASDKQNLWNRFAGQCACWEGAAAGRICNLNDVPYAHVRGITDMADQPETAARDFNLNIQKVSISVVSILVKFIETL